MIGWPERLAVLRDLGRWEHALLLALTLLEAAQVSSNPLEVHKTPLCRSRMPLGGYIEKHE